MRINKHDTNGTKTLLGKGELGYDDYTAGGDTGRVYVGTGTENIALAKRIESNIMSKAQFNALAEERKANRAGSGFDSFGKHYSDVSVIINEGMWTSPTYQNKFVLGRNASGAGVSKTTYPVININGVVQKIMHTNTSSVNNAEISLPTAPNIYPYDAVLTAEQIASGVIKHADSSNSGLIVNGKFDVDTSGWAAGNSSTLSIDNGILKITNNTSFGNAYQAIRTVVGKKYLLEYNQENTILTNAHASTTINTSGSLGLVSSTTVGRKYLEFTATTTTTYVLFYAQTSTPSTFIMVDNIAVYPADAISRSDLVFLELTTSNAA